MSLCTRTWALRAGLAALIGLAQLIAGRAHAQYVQYVHTDALGSPVAITDQSRRVVERTEYEPYGKVLGAPVQDGPGYTGHVSDAATGLSYMQQRYYDPGIGRFLSADPIAADTYTAWNFDRYSYAANNPYKFKDPNGRIIETVWDVANVVMDVASLSGNLAAGNYAGAALDTGGLIVDAAATVVPGVPGGAGAAIKAARGLDKARDVLRANRVAGKAGEAATRAKLGERIAGEQVTFKTSDGTRTRPDFVTKEKGIVESKSGGAQLTTGQAKLKADVDAGREVTPVGKNAERAGLQPGVPTKMTSCEVDRC